MAKLFEEIFQSGGSGDTRLVITDPRDARDPMGAEDALHLCCHSLILTQQSYFYKMLGSETPLREGITREALISEPRTEFVELLRFIYTNQVDINEHTVLGLLTLADKYCIDEVVDLCLKYIKDKFDADMFFTFYDITTLNSTYQDKLKTPPCTLGRGGDLIMASDMKPPQFEGGGPMVLVRNTFLDIEDPPDPAGEIVRSKTAPPGSGGPWAEDLGPGLFAAFASDLESEEEEEEEQEAASPYGEVAGASPISPGSDDLDEKDDQICRTVTHEWLEDWELRMCGPGVLCALGDDRDPKYPVLQGRLRSECCACVWPGVGAESGALPASAGSGATADATDAPAADAPDAAGMVFMPVAMAPAPAPTAPMNAGGGTGPSGPGAPGGGYGAPLPELPVRQPDRGARWPVAGVGPLPVGPMPQNAQNSVIVTDGSSAPNSAMAVSSSGRDSTAPPQPQTLTRAFSVKSGFFRVHWTVDGRKLRGNEKQTVSPPFELSFGPKYPAVTFKMMIYPEMLNEGKGGCCFRKSKGRGYVQIKCEAELEESVAWVSFRISIGSGNKTVGPRGPRYHNFSQSAVTGLEEGRTKDEHIWDFTEVLDEASQTFVVCLEIVPGGRGVLRDGSLERCLAILVLCSRHRDFLQDQLMKQMLLRRNLCAITDDPRWEELPIGLVESILRQDNLPIASEAEVLTLIAKWIGSRQRKQEEVTRLLRSFRKGDSVRVRVSDMAALMGALGWDIFSDKVPRTGASVWDPNFTIHRHEGAGTQGTGPSESAERREGNTVEIIHQMGPKDFLQQEPGWAYPGAHRCRVKLTSNCWSHRERRLLRGGPGQAVALQKRAFECSPAKPTERSPSPPPSFQVRRPPVDTFETFDIAPMSDGSEQSFLGGAVIRNLTQDKIDHELVDHQVICGVSSGYQRHGFRISQCDKKAIYLVEALLWLSVVSGLDP
ncbi:BTBD19 [Symbiodinium sp. CCMP2592]|nr:BTBD19 [Symbiodinium sp. CCMP2592]